MPPDNATPNPPAEARPLLLRWWMVLPLALALYGLTLNHSFTLGSLPLAAQAMGWNWHPAPLSWRPDPSFRPFLFGLANSLRVIPQGWRLLGLNATSALCAALTLCILARSVRLLPQRSTHEQRERPQGERGLLAVRAAFLPPALAVALLAGQRSFWEHAVAATGEMFDLLVLAFLILCLLEHRVSRNDRWLHALALVYGVGVVNDWALIGFFPLFLLALIWIKGLGFLAPGFIPRMLGWGCLGLLLYGLDPLLGALAGDGRFLSLLKMQLGTQHRLLFGLPRRPVELASAFTLVPVFFAAITWPSFKAGGDLSPFARNMANGLFRLLHLVCLAVGAWVLLGVNFYPRQAAQQAGLAAPALLSFYYLAALSVGYFSGYVLLVFGEEAVSARHRISDFARQVNRCIVGLLWAASVLLPLALFAANLPRLRDYNKPVLDDFSRVLAASLPAKPAVVLADDAGLLYLTMNGCRGLGLPAQYAFVESRALVEGGYLRYLAGRYSILSSNIANPAHLPELLTPAQAGAFLASLSQRAIVYYLQPSFGDYFERVYLTPNGIGGYLHAYPSNALVEPIITREGLATNQAYWDRMTRGPLARLTQSPPETAESWAVARAYSLRLDNWGAELQKASAAYHQPALLNDAGNAFSEALRLNSQNFIARANLQFNEHLRGVAPSGAALNSASLADLFRNHWDAALSVFGPVEVPDLDLQAGLYFAQHGALLQAARCFQRSLDLATNNSDAQIALTAAYIDLGQLDFALRMLDVARQNPSANPLNLTRLEALLALASRDNNRADQVLTAAHAKNPADPRLAALMGDIYQKAAYNLITAAGTNAASRQTAVRDAAPWFKKSLAALDQELESAGSLGVNPQEIAQINLRRAGVQLALQDYQGAILTLSAVARAQPDDPIPVLNRAAAEFECGRLDDARKDYQYLAQKLAHPWPIVYLGLFEIAQKQNDKPAAIHYVKLFLKNMPPESPEAAEARKQLAKLQGD